MYYDVTNTSHLKQTKRHGVRERETAAGDYIAFVRGFAISWHAPKEAKHVIIIVIKNA